MNIKTRIKIISFALLASTSLQVDSQTLHLVKSEAEAMSKHEESVRTSAAFLADDAFAQIMTDYKVGKGDELSIKAYCQIKEQKKSLQNYVITDPFLRYREKEKIDSIYRDSINILLIPKNPSLSGKIISMALQMSDFLELKQKKKDAIMNTALNLSRKLRKTPCADVTVEEMTCLRKNLTKKQLEEVVDEKNMFSSKLKAQKAWDALDREGMTDELDSAQQMIRAEMYYRLEMRYHDIYVGQPEQLRHNLDDLYGSKPKIIGMYEALDERKRIEEKRKEYEKNVKKEKQVGAAFAW